MKWFEGEHAITAGPETLMRQAHYTAHEYMLHAEEDIDQVFGEGFAKKHPEVIAAYMQTAAMDFGAAILAQQIRCGLADIAAAIAAAKEKA